ncbi:coiled-coil domain-containing protein 114 isoform X2 [Nelusetta ayraudi]|uniref:coiled-coil domain-containing protein 114 isoform X2 n=2 Tax=Nelusetta ayraudi TaxID=303726 RepID=UPI003F71719B
MVSYAHDGPSRSPYFDSNCRNLQHCITMNRGRAAPSARSDTSDMDSEESEITRLRRQLRIMEGDRHVYNFQTREKIRKQEQEIDNLMREQEELHRNLGTANRFSHEQQADEDAAGLRALLEQGDLLEDEMKKEKQAKMELEKEIMNMQQKMTDLKRDAASSITSVGSEEKPAHTFRTLEYKLDRQFICFNELMTKKSQVRKELHTLQIERVRFQRLKTRLEKELEDSRKEIDKFLLRSISAHDARVEAQTKMMMIKERADKDIFMYNIEIKELERIIAHECRLKEYMTTKCNERSGQDDTQDTGPSQLSQLKDQRMVDLGEESLENLEEVFQRIHTMKGEDNLDILVTRFIQEEDRNFAHYNFVNEQNNEAQALKDRISQMDAEIEQFKEESSQQEKNNNSRLGDIDKQQKQTESWAEDYERQTSVISKILDDVRAAISSTLKTTQCDYSALEDALGSSAGITESNVMSYMSLVELKTIELLAIRAYLESKDVDKDYNPKELAKSLLGQYPKLLKQDIVIEPTHDGMDFIGSPDSEEEEVQLSHDELRQRIINTVLQQQSPTTES